MGNRLRFGCRMDSFSRLTFIGSVLAVALFCFACETFAFGNVANSTGGQEWRSLTTAKGYSPYFAEASQACDWQRDQFSASSTTTRYVTEMFSGPSCQIAQYAISTNAKGNPITVGLNARGNNCPVDADHVIPGDLNSGCVCKMGYSPNSGASACSKTSCVDRRNTEKPTSYQKNTWDSSATACVAGCVVRGDMAVQNATGGGGVIYNAAPTGEACNPDAAAPDAPSGSDATKTPTTLAPGKCPGTVNGTPVVVPCGDKAGTQSKQTQTNSDGSKTETTKTTECVGGACKTTTTEKTTDATGRTSTKTTVSEGADSMDKNSTAGSSGSSSGATSEQEPAKSLCELSPDIPACKTSTAEASCSGGAASVSCDGDAVQCAIMRDMITRNCQLYDKTSPQSDKGFEAVAAGDQPGDHPHSSSSMSQSSVSFSSSISQAELIGASCPADVTVPMGRFQPLVLSFAGICGPAAILGNVGVAFAWIFCLFIVFKRD